MKREELRQLPKVELHCHLDGSLSLGAIRQLGELANIPIPADDEVLKMAVQAPKSGHDLLDYLKAFDYVLPLLQSAEALTLAAEDVIAQVAAEHVCYIEVRFAPIFHTRGGLSIEQVIKAVLRGLKRGENKYGVKSNALLCGMRQLETKVNNTVFKTGAEFMDRGVVGFDFAGNERDFPTGMLTSSIAYAQQLGVPLTIHAGECGCVQNVAEAIQLGIMRVGHGTALFDHQAIMREMANKQVLVELCLTSNIQTNAMTSIADYPLIQLMTNDVPVCINTDNRTVSDTTLTDEYLLFQDLFGITKAEFGQFNLNAINGAFTDEETKEKLRVMIQKSYSMTK